MAKDVTDRIDQVQTIKAATALLKHLEVQRSKKKTLIDDDDSEIIQLVVALKKIPKSSQTKPIRMYDLRYCSLCLVFCSPIPHSLYRPAETQICLICKDPQKDMKKRIADGGIKEVSKVIGLSKLKSNYKPYEAKRQLCASYEVFLADEAIIPLLPPLIGKVFFRSKKQPIPVNLKQKNIAREIAYARDSTYMFIPSGPSLYVQCLLAWL